MKLIVGLGNPGSSYENTRHNIGFRLIKAFAKQREMTFRKATSLQGELAQGDLEGVKLILLMPMTYMNSSGEAVRLCMDYFKVNLNDLFLISDDVALPFGKLRLRRGGSSGGHKGLKSVEEHLATQDYPRLRIGVGDRLAGELADYVLGRFSKEEEAELPRVIEQASLVLKTWILSGIEAAMQLANQGELDGKKT